MLFGKSSPAIILHKIQEIPALALVVLLSGLAGLVQGWFGNVFLLAALLILLAFMLVYVYPQWAFPAVVFLSLVDLTPGNVAGIPNLLLREALFPLFFVAYLLHKLRRRQDLRLFSTPITSFATLFAGVLLLNYIRHPVLPANLLGTGVEQGGLRSYLDGAGGIMALLIAFWSVTDYPSVSETGLKFLKSIIVFFVAVGITAWLAGHPIRLPLLPENSQYWEGVDFSYLYGGKSLRIGQLQTFGPLLTAWALASLPRTPFGKVLRFAGIAGGITATFLSGGRSVFLGLIFAVCVYEFVLIRRQTWSDILLLAVTGWTGVTIAQSVFPGQFARITSLAGGLAQQVPDRLVLYKVYWQGFLQSPILGQGIGFKPHMINFVPSLLGANYVPFFEQQLITGGHGTYLSMLYLFGVLGAAVWFGLFISVLIAFYKAAKSRLKERSSLGLWARMGFLFVIGLLPAYAVGGNGLNEPWFYLLSGVGAALIMTHGKEQLRLNSKTSRAFSRGKQGNAG